MRTSTLRCTACHCCATCSEVKEFCNFAQKAKDCRDCQRHTETWHCDACDKMLQRDMFNKDMLDNKRWRNRKMVCLACAARGFSPRDVTAYKCEECGEQGHLKFAGHLLANCKKPVRQTELLCMQCCRRFATIKLNLKDKKALRCTCRDSRHSHSNEQCKLYPQKAGEKLWPGCNLTDDKAVTEEDYKFYERMHTRKQQKTNHQ